MWIAILVAACGRAPNAAGTGEPATGVVSLLPSITAWMVELGAEDRLVACTEFCRPGRDVPRVPWQGPAAAEAILRTGARLVLKQKPRAEDALRGLLENAGLTVVAVPSETIADARRALTSIGAALHIDTAARLAAFDAAMASARRKADGRRPPSVLMVYARDPGPVGNISAAGPGSFLDELIRYAGGANILADLDKPYLDIRVETVLRREPAIIIDASRNAKQEDWDALRTVPAVSRGRVHVLGGDLVTVPGPRLPEAVARLVELLHGA